MWYRFEPDKMNGIWCVKNYQVAFYKDGKCFDESFYGPDEINNVLAYIETEEDQDDLIHSRVFVHFDNGDEYELTMSKVRNTIKL